MHYQPGFRLNDWSMAGSEALIRWNDPLRGMISPGEFIPGGGDRTYREDWEVGTRSGMQTGEAMGSRRVSVRPRH
jgi:hypothetical protein